MTGSHWPESLAAALIMTAAPVLAGAQETGSELIARFDLREHPVAMRELPGWTPPRHIVVLGPEAWAEPLRAAVPGVAISVAPTPDSAARILGNADVYIGMCSPAIVEAGRNLRWIQLWSAGADRCAELIAASGRPIIVTNAQALYGPQIAEHTVGFMVTLARQLHRYRDEQRAGQWMQAMTDPSVASAQGIRELNGSNLLVIGLGGVGTEVARRAHALGMRVRATRNSSREGPQFVEYVGLAHEALELARWADVIVNSTPLTADTRGMFDARFFAAMKPSAHFINVGRGESVVTEDLVSALEAGRLAGAALDVTDPEPLPPGHPLWTMPNVILTPHVAAASDHFVARATQLAAENLRRYVRGDRLVSVVDLRRGY